MVAGGFGAPPAGVYNTTPGRFPADSYRNTNYFVDAVFETTSNAPLSASSHTPADGATGVPAGTRISAVLSREVQRESVSIVLRDAAGTPAAGTTRYSAASRTAEFLPQDPLEEGIRYTAELTATDTEGRNLGSGGNWSFTTARTVAEGECPCSLFTEDSIPALPQLSDGIPLSLGVAFRPDAAGTVTGIRFYKGPGNTGVHTGRLFAPGGAELAAVTFSGESSSGWQSASFAVPVPVQAGKEYVAAYSSPAGGYSANLGQFAGSYTFGPLTVPAEGGRFVYGGTYPERKSASGYLVDVVFERSGPPWACTPGHRPTAQPGFRRTPRYPVCSPTMCSPVPCLSTSAARTEGPSAGRPATTPEPAPPYSPRLPVGRCGRLYGAAAATAAGLQPDGSGSWTFTTAEPTPGSACCSLFPPDTVPAVPVVADGVPVVLGTAFRTSADGLLRDCGSTKDPAIPERTPGRSLGSTAPSWPRRRLPRESVHRLAERPVCRPGSAPGGGAVRGGLHFAVGNVFSVSGPVRRGVRIRAADVDPSGGRFTYSGGFPASTFSGRLPGGCPV